LSEVAINIGWAFVFLFIGGVVGIGLVPASSLALPRLIERMTPNLDEERGIARGSVANAGDCTPPATATKSKATVTGLTSGTRYWFRVAAIGSAGQGPWSDPATAIAS
jgi:hypothetical protein